MLNEFNRHDALLIIIESPVESGSSLKQNVAQCQVSCTADPRRSSDGSPKAIDLNERIFIVLLDWPSALDHRSAQGRPRVYTLTGCICRLWPARNHRDRSRHQLTV